jgi:antitoxin component YwqK of YwqJK toxin-antitoxin module
MEPKKVTKRNPGVGDVTIYHPDGTVEVKKPYTTAELKDIVAKYYRRKPRRFQKDAKDDTGES